MVATAMAFIMTDLKLGCSVEEWMGSECWWVKASHNVFYTSSSYPFHVLEGLKDAER